MIVKTKYDLHSKHPDSQLAKNILFVTGNVAFMQGEKAYGNHLYRGVTKF